MTKGMALLGGLFLVALLLLAACNSGPEEAEPTPTPTPASVVIPPSPTPEPTPTATAAPSPTPPAGGSAAPQLAFVGSNGAIWLVNADGSGRTMFTDACSDQQIGDPETLDWSPGGDKLAPVCLSADASQRTLIVLDESGQPVTKVEGVGGFPIWSPDGQRLAYQTDAFIGTQPPQYEVRMLDLTTLEDTSVADEALLLEWAQPDRMLVGLNVQDPGLGFNYDAHWLDLDTSQTEPVPRFDDSALFWLNPDATKSAVVNKEASGPVLGIYDLQTGDERPIPNSVIQYPSEFIPSRHVVFSRDGSTIYWADVRLPPTDIYRATTDGGEPTKLASLVNAAAVEFSPDRMRIAYIVAGNPPTLWTANIDGSEAHEIGPVFNAFAWRPTP